MRLDIVISRRQKKRTAAADDLETRERLAVPNKAEPGVGSCDLNLDLDFSF